MCDAWDALWWGSQNNWDYVMCNVCTCHDVWTWNADVINWVQENKSLTTVWRVWEMVFLTAVTKHSSSISVGDGEQRWLCWGFAPCLVNICRTRLCLKTTLRGITCWRGDTLLMDLPTWRNNSAGDEFLFVGDKHTLLGESFAESFVIVNLGWGELCHVRES